MLELEDARQRILAALPTPTAERVSLREACHRVLSENISSPVDLPPFDNSAMDGYAVRLADVASAKPASPVNLRVVGRVVAGEDFSGELTGGDCVRVFTGSPLPAGTEAVVMQEDTRTEATRPGEVLILDSARPGENLRRSGQDVSRGASLAKRGDLLTPGKIALLAATGIAEVSVGRRPVVGLLATGSELREAGETLSTGQIYDSNRSALAPLVKRAGALPNIFPLVPDTLDDTRAELERAFGESDVVVTSGGVSVGEMDFMKSAFGLMGGELQFWKVAIRPGKPFVFGRVGEKFWFGLPGNPVSALVTFLLLVRCALLRWQGASDVALSSHPGVLAENLGNPGDRRHFMRVRVDASGKIFSAGRQASHALASFADANGLVDVPPQTTLATGATVQVIRWD